MRRLAAALPDGAQLPARQLLQKWRRVRDRPRWGNLRRREPFSHVYGFDRGQPVDRVYIERFLSAHSLDVRGTVLEVKDAAYTRAFGADRVTASEVLDLDGNNSAATLIADLGARDSLPRARFDCVICTQTLQLIPRLDMALANLWVALRPDGVLLLTVPSITRVESSYARGDDLWRLIPAGLEAFVRGQLPGALLTVRGYGNLVTTIAYLLGLAAQDLRAEDFESDDAAFPLVAAARVVRPS